jgi:hypothetical protein
MKKYEYKVVNFGVFTSLAKIELQLNQLGQQGWELVTFATYGSYIVTLKRELSDNL